MRILGSSVETHRLLDRQRLLEILDSVQEYQDLVASERCCVGRAGLKVSPLPLVRQFEAHIYK